MADFTPLLSRAIAGLEKNTAEARRVLYDRARSALVTQLRNMDPPLSESGITRERLGLEEAIRKIEAEFARGQRESALPPPPPLAADKPAPVAPALVRPVPPKPESPKPVSSKPVSSKPATTMPPDSTPEAAATPVSPQETADARLPAGPESEPAERKVSPFQARIDRLTGGNGKPSFRAAMKEAAQLGEDGLMTRAAREVRAEPPTDAGDAESPPVPASIPDMPPRPPVQPAAELDEAAPVPADEASFRKRKSKIEPRPANRPAVAVRPRFDDLDAPDGTAGGRVRFWAIVIGIFSLVVVAAVIGLLAASGKLALFGGGERPRAEAPLTQPAERPKIVDRVTQEDTSRAPAGQPRGEGQAQPLPQPQPQGQPPAEALQVAQRAILYEEDPAAGQQGQVLIGTVAWRTETVTPGPGLPPDIAIRADVQVPDRRMAAAVTIRRNVDSALPASHTIELLFTTPPDFPFGGVAKVPGILAKRSEGQRGAPLAGLAVDVTAGFFIVGLSAIEADVQRNLQLLKERAWLDIPLVYKNGRRAILSIEKGLPGDKVFEDAFTAWGQ